ncbi:HPr-rel-A system PqqD family peptide chaperone [Massilia sp. CMS3.1]|uniref:HPr-rel-A system PqqD family peptide chaperone n=1 Tax=Massilia sp. CMS3.1 TaxID=3373083 RepID=UPI003EE7B82E
MTNSPIWRLAPGQRLLHRCWDGECVLYNDLSGDTHLLDEFALALLHHLQAGPQPASRLAAHFEFDFDADPGAAPARGDAWAPPVPHDEFLHAVLTDLAALHLIDCAPC